MPIEQATQVTNAITGATSMTEVELKQQKLAKIVKIGVLLAVCAVLGPLAYLAIKGIVGLAAFGALVFIGYNAAPVIARFLPGQRFDLQATIRPDDSARTIAEVSFSIDGKAVNVPVLELSPESLKALPQPEKSEAAKPATGTTGPVTYPPLEPAQR